jgi:hypothetical protein
MLFGQHTMLLAGELILPPKICVSKLCCHRSKYSTADPVSEVETFLDTYWEDFYSLAPTFRPEVLSWMFVSLPDCSHTQIPNLMEYTGDQEEPQIEANSFGRPDQVL